MNEMIKNCIIEMVDGAYDYCLIDNDTKKMDIEWVNDGCFSITLYYKNDEIDEWDDDWIEQETWESNNFLGNYSELFLGEVNVIDEMTNDIMKYIKGYEYV